MNSRAKIHVLDHEFLKVPSHVFKDSVESTLKVIQTLTNAITSHLHKHDHALSGCVDLLGLSTQVLRWSLHAIFDSKGLHLYTYIYLYTSYLSFISYFCFVNIFVELGMLISY